MSQKLHFLPFGMALLFVLSTASLAGKEDVDAFIKAKDIAGLTKYLG